MFKIKVKIHNVRECCVCQGLGRKQTGFIDLASNVGSENSDVPTQTPVISIFWGVPSCPQVERPERLPFNCCIWSLTRSSSSQSYRIFFSLILI